MKLLESCFSHSALAKMEGLAAISLQIDVVPDFNLNGERIRWVTEQSIRTSVSRPGTRIREVPWVTWKRSRNSWSGGHPLLSFCSSIDDPCGKERFLVSYAPLAIQGRPRGCDTDGIGNAQEATSSSHESQHSGVSVVCSKQSNVLAGAHGPS